MINNVIDKINMPPVPDTDSQPHVSNNMQNVVSLDVARQIANEAANEAANRAVSNVRSVPSEQPDDINLEKEMKRAFYKKLTTPSFGETLATQIDSNLASQLASKLIPNLFGGTGEVDGREKGAMGFILDILNTKFAYGAGQTMGNNATEIIKSLGEKRIGQIIDTYQNRMNPDSRQQSMSETIEQSDEDQQKKTESILMGLDSTNSEHVLNFMKATGIKDFTDAQHTILTEQSRILRSRGQIESNDEHIVHKASISKHKEHEEPSDINRQLIQEYSNDSNESKKGSFFDTEHDNIREDEFILSLDPNNPASLHQYMSYRKISGVDNDTVKKMIIKEQDKYLHSLSSSKTNNQDIHQPIPVQIPDPDETKIMSKEEFYKEIGLKTPNQAINESSKPQNETKIQTQPEIVSPSGTDITNIMTILNNIGNNFENSMKSLTEKINSLENDITVLKSSAHIGEFVIGTNLPSNFGFVRPSIKCSDSKINCDSSIIEVDDSEHVDIEPDNMSCEIENDTTVENDISSGNDTIGKKDIAIETNTSENATTNEIETNTTNDNNVDISKSNSNVPSIETNSYIQNKISENDTETEEDLSDEEFVKTGAKWSQKPKHVSKRRRF